MRRSSLLAVLALCVAAIPSAGQQAATRVSIEPHVGYTFFGDFYSDRVMLSGQDVGSARLTLERHVTYGAGVSLRLGATHWSLLGDFDRAGTNGDFDICERGFACNRFQLDATIVHYVVGIARDFEGRRGAPATRLFLGPALQHLGLESEGRDRTYNSPGGAAGLRVIGHPTARTDWYAEVSDAVLKARVQKLARDIAGPDIPIVLQTHYMNVPHVALGLRLGF